MPNSSMPMPNSKYIFCYHIGMKGFVPMKGDVEFFYDNSGQPKEQIFGVTPISEEDYEHKSLDELQLLYPLDTSKISES